ncbi:MAG: DUF4290 domain-containing protein [Prevotella sp.]|nr:DUF4290 domain-containing protein [Prevotella sp.]
MQGLDYNTQRERLLLPEYGREIQKMVEHAVSLPLREDRQRCANTIVKMMAKKITLVRDIADQQQALWDHLYIMSHKQLDIDWPYDVSDAEKILSKPEPMKLPQQNIRLRHYGRLVEEMCEKLKEMPAGEERDVLARHTANQMKRDLVLWGHGNSDDEKVVADLAEFTDGIIQLDLSSFSFEPMRITGLASVTGKKKKKKG